MPSGWASRAFLLPALKNWPIPPIAHQRSPAKANSPELQIAERADWTLFRSLNTLPQQAGVPLSQMRCLVLKELVDNGLDVSAVVDVWRTPDGVYVVRDRGPGISDDPAEIARRFSIKRPL